MAFGYGVYFTQKHKNQVVRFDPDSDECTVIVSDSEDETTDENLNKPYGLAMGPNNVLYIADKLNHRLCKVNAQGEFCQFDTHDTTGHRKPKIKKQEHFPRTPTGIAVETSGDLICSYCDEHTIYRVKQDGELELLLGTAPGNHFTFRGLRNHVPLEELSDFPIYMPTALTASGDSGIYFIERGYEAVRRYHPDEGLSTVFCGDVCSNNLPDSSDEIDLSVFTPAHPTGLAVDSEGRLFVSDGMTGSVVRVDFSSNTFKVILPSSDRCGNSSPIAIGNDGTLWILSLKNNSLCGYTEDGNGYWVSNGKEITTEDCSPPDNVREWGGIVCG